MIVSRSVPTPRMSAPMSISIEQRSEISGSRAALSMIVSPSASTAAVSKFSVAPTLGKRSTISVPRNRDAVARTSLGVRSKVAPIRVSPSTCRSIGREPKSSPPGRPSTTEPYRVRSGPSRLIEARMRSTISNGATGCTLPEFTISRWCASVRVQRKPRASSSSHIVATSAMSGTLLKR